LAFGATDLVGDQLMEASLHRPTPLAVPHDDEIGDLLQRTVELLRPSDERQPGQRVVVVKGYPASVRVGGSTKPIPS
jgi:hypothetical protein